MPGLRMKQEKILEAVLFASGDSVPIARLAEAVGCDIPATRNLLNHMSEAYAEEQAGVLLMEMDDAFQLCTNPMYYEYVQKLLKIPARKTLTQPLLETLSIIVYKQPVTKGVIEEIRGVNADHSVNKLVEYGLVVERGRLDAPGRPILFGTSEDFLRFYGLKNLDELWAMYGAEDTPEITTEA